MQINRRGFLGAVLGGVAALAVDDPERAAWVKGAKTFSVMRPELRMLTFGDVITFNGIWDTHPQTGMTLPFRKRFAVTASVISSADLRPMDIYPPILNDGPYRNVDDRRPTETIKPDQFRLWNSEKAWDTPEQAHARYDQFYGKGWEDRLRAAGPWIQSDQLRQLV